MKILKEASETAFHVSASAENAMPARPIRKCSARHAKRRSRPQNAPDAPRLPPKKDMMTYLKPGAPCAIGKLYLHKGQNRSPQLARACAVDMHMDISRTFIRERGPESLA